MSRNEVAQFTVWSIHDKVGPISYLGVSSPCVSSVPHGPPRAHPPSLSGFDPPRGRPSSVGHSAPLITADLRSELPAAYGGLSAVRRVSAGVHDRAD